jgi:hypothetical protein
MFQVLALTGLYQPPSVHMTQADWRSVHCDGDSECHVMKTKALAPELQVIFRIAHAASVAAQRGQRLAAAREEGTAARRG